MKFRPEAFDILGVFTFLFIAYVSLRALATEQALSDEILVILLIIGIAGLIIDSTSVYIAYFKKRDGYHD